MEDLKQIMPKKLGFGCMRLPVANGNSGEDDRNTAGKGNALFNGVNDLVQVHMSRNDVVLGTHDTDERFLEFFIG